MILWKIMNLLKNQTQPKEQRSIQDFHIMSRSSLIPGRPSVPSLFFSPPTAFSKSIHLLEQSDGNTERGKGHEG